jgi:hypothetical protein
MVLVTEFSTSTSSSTSSHRSVPLHLPELHLGFVMLLDVRSDTIRLRSQPLMSSSSNEPLRAPQRRSATFDPEPVCHHLPELATNSMPHYEPTNAVGDLSSGFLPPSPIPLSFSTTDSLLVSPQPPQLLQSGSPTPVSLLPSFSHYLTTGPCWNRPGRRRRAMGERIPCFCRGPTWKAKLGLAQFNNGI